MRLSWSRGLVVLGLSTGLSLTSTYAADVTLPANVQAGDIIFREGTEAVSDAVIAIDGGPFSHVGLLMGKPGAWQVLHATPSEIPGRPDGVVLDTLSFYIDSQRSKRYAVYHVDADSSQRARAINAAHAMLGKPFRLADSAGTYCTFVVWDAWRQAGVDLDVTFTRLALPLMNGEYLLPSALMASQKLSPVSWPPQTTLTRSVHSASLSPTR